MNTHTPDTPTHSHDNPVDSPGCPHEGKKIKHGLNTEDRELVTIFIKGKPYPVKRGEYSVDQILELVGETSAGYNLYEEKPGEPPMPVPENEKLNIVGCETFTYQVKSGTSS